MGDGPTREKSLNDMTFAELDAKAHGLMESVLDGDPASVKELKNIVKAMGEKNREFNSVIGKAPDKPELGP